MLKKLTYRSAFLLSLVLFVAPTATMYADEPCDTVTGCDPVPPPPETQAMLWLLALSMPL